MSFSDLGLSPEVLKAIGDAGYETPTPIQEQAIPYVLMGRDVLGCAQTGTGKTASFTLPMIEILSSGRARARMPRSLILTPTRELATQISENFEIYGKYNKLTMALLIGGVAMDEQIQKLDRGVDVLIATPGRFLDHFERGRLLLTDIKVLVIDEADRMLDMGFIPDVERIVGRLPKIRQTLFFSATMPPEIRRLSDAFLMNPKQITVAPQSRPVTETVTQSLLVVSDKNKREALRRLIEKESIGNAIIFCNRKRDVDILYKSLRKHGVDAAALHGDMDQPVRTETLERFKRGDVGILVASDVAARGLDVDDLPFVINFDVPIHSEDYIHRIGRTGRAGRAGKAFTLATPADGGFVDAIEKLIGNAIPRTDVDGVDTEALEEGSDRRRRGRRSGASKPGRSQSERPAPKRSEAKTASREQENRDDGEPKKPEAAPTKSAKPASGKPEREPRPSRGRTGGDRPPRQKGGRRGGGRDDGDDAVVGMGDHVPAFLLRPARPTSG